MKEKAKSILEIDSGKLMNQANYELSKIMMNLKDINANPKKKRELSIKITFLPVGENSEDVIINYQVNSKLSPVNAKQLILRQQAKKDPETGEIIDVLIETSNVAAGQLNLDGEIHEPEVFLIGHDADRVIKKEKIN